MSSRFLNDTSGSASLDVTPSLRSGSKFTGCQNECNVDMSPVAHPVQRLPAKLSTMPAASMEQGLIDLELPAIGHKNLYFVFLNFIHYHLIYTTPNDVFVVILCQLRSRCFSLKNQ